MKITVWIRGDANGNRTMRVDAKYESLDDPRICNFGNRLMKALEGGCANENQSTEGR